MWPYDKKCEQTTAFCTPHRNTTPDEFCNMGSNDQWAKCNALTDIDSCAIHGDGCKWTASAAASSYPWGTGRNNYPGCIVNCNGCVGEKARVQKNKGMYDACLGVWGWDSLASERGCDKQYEVPNMGNTKLCIWDPFHGWCLPGREFDSESDDRFCSRQKLSPLDCVHKDKDGFCYTTGAL